MGRNRAYKLFAAAVVLSILIFPLISSAFDMQYGMSEADKSAYIEAHEHFSAGRYKKAEESVLDYTKPGVSDHGLFHLLMGNIMLETDRYLEAQRYYTKAAEYYGDNSDLYVHAGLAAYGNKNMKEALNLMAKAVELGTEDRQAYRVLAEAAIQERRYGDAAEALRGIKEKEDQDYRLLLYIYAVSDDTKRARHLLHHLSRHSVRSEWWRLYGIYTVGRNPEEAAAAFRVYARAESPPEKDLRMISGVLARQKVYDEAYELLGRVSEPTCSDLLELAKLALKLGRTDKSERLLKSALAKSCGRRSGLLLANIYYRTGRYGESAGMFERYGDRPGYRYMAALARYRNDEYGKAEKLLRGIKEKGIKTKAEKLLKKIGYKNDN